MIFQGKPIKAAIFDMDGTMFDTERLRFRTIQQASIELFGESISTDILIGSLGLSAKKAEELARQTYGNDYPYREIRQRADQLELDYIRSNGVPVKPGLYDVLERLKKNHILMAVATSSRREIAEEYLLNANILKYFDITVCGDEVEQGKPHPEIFMTAAQALSCEPESCLMFEDSENGLLSAVQAGGQAILIKDIKEPTPEMRAMAFRCYSHITEFLQNLINATPKLAVPDLQEAFPQSLNQLKVGIHGFGAMGGGYLSQIFSHWDGYTRPCEIIATTSNHTLRDLINGFGKYNIEYNHSGFQQTIENVRLIDSNDETAVCKMYVESEIIGLCLPESAIRQQASLIAKCLLQRHEINAKPLTILIILNKILGGTFVQKLVQQALAQICPENLCQDIMHKTSFTETMVNRIVSRTSIKNLSKQAKINFYNIEHTLAQQPATSIDQCAESSLPDSTAHMMEQLRAASSISRTMNALHLTAFNSDSEMVLYAQKGCELLERLRQIQTVDNIKDIQTIKNKLLNGSHAIIGWYSALMGYATIAQGIGDARVLQFVSGVINMEIKPALEQESPETSQFAATFINNFIRHCELSFKDSCLRVGRDPLRKLQTKERIIGSILLAQQYGIATPLLEFGAALGLLYAVRLTNPLDKESQFMHALYAETQSIVPLITYQGRIGNQSYQGLDIQQHEPLIKRIEQHFHLLQTDPAYLLWPLYYVDAGNSAPSLKQRDFFPLPMYSEHIIQV